MSNLLKNSDFASGELEPWTITPTEVTGGIKKEGAVYYVQLAKAAGLSQSLPEGNYKPSKFTFYVRAGEIIKPGDSILFSYGVLISTVGSAEAFGDISVATEEWKKVTLEMKRKPIPATTVTVQVHTVSDPEKLKTQAGQVHFKDFELT
ncbi:hypothetical protein [Pseudomonas sp. PS02290]|uniref:hypothetical protein n=1 Tax=Pseudomonas sp. PS02290 TaxID=2991430 RepID=UPI00249B3AE8|nr:hypothetical protein [Pseudomonas sp. PS02290]